MQSKGPENNVVQILRPDNIIQIIESDYHKKINEFCNIVNDFVLQNAHLDDVDLSVSELLNLLVTKLNDEIRHLILKEKGILFPIIKKGLENTTDKKLIDKQIFGPIKTRHLLITELVERIRRVLIDQNSLHELSADWKVFFEALILLDDKINEWTYLEQNLLFPQLIGEPPAPLAN
jgi:iron-sulfur cluster repair protein YtfE (RIC family)